MRSIGLDVHRDFCGWRSRMAVRLARRAGCRAHRSSLSFSHRASAVTTGWCSRLRAIPSRSCESWSRTWRRSC
jgi:hypothetical protein